VNPLANNGWMMSVNSPQYKPSFQLNRTIADGRFGINIVSGWNQSEYVQMGLWPGDWYYERRYDYASEYVTLMRELWATGQSDFKGEFFTMRDCRLSPRPKAGAVAIVCAGQSERGMQFCAQYGDYQFIIGLAMTTSKLRLPTPGVC
jgi:pyrimidine oxygenase